MTAATNENAPARSGNSGEGKSTHQAPNKHEETNVPIIADPAAQHHRQYFKDARQAVQA